MSWTGIPGESQSRPPAPLPHPPMSIVWATWSPSSSASNFLTRSHRLAVIQGNICDLMSGWDELECVSLRPHRLVWTLLLLAPIWLNFTSWRVSPTPPFPFLFFNKRKTQQSTLNICLGGLLSTPPLYPAPHSYYKIFSPLGVKRSCSSFIQEGSGSLPRWACSADRTLF